MDENIVVHDVSERPIGNIDGGILPFDNTAAHATASVVAERRHAGRPGELRDSMIAGIGLATGDSLAARNTRHFADLAISVIDPWTIDPVPA